MLEKYPKVFDSSLFDVSLDQGLGANLCDS